MRRIRVDSSHSSKPSKIPMTLPPLLSVADVVRIFHKLPNSSINFTFFVSNSNIACLMREWLLEKSWWRSAHRANIAFFCCSLSSLKKKKQTVPGRVDWDSGLRSSSTREAAKTDLPHPGSADTHNRLDVGSSLQCRYFGCRKNHSHVPGTLSGFLLRCDS